MTRLHRKVPDPPRTARLGVRRMQPPPAARPATADADGFGDLGSLILYGQA